MKTPQSVDNRETVLLVGVSLKKAPGGGWGDPLAAGRDSVEELHELAESAGAKIAGSILQVREQLDPATLVGRGKLDEIRAEAELRHVPLVIVDHNLTPVQLRNMAKGSCRWSWRNSIICCRGLRGAAKSFRGWAAASARAALANKNWEPTAAGFAIASAKSKKPSRLCGASAPRAGAHGRPCRWA